MAWTTYGVRDGSRGETNDKLSRWGSTRGIMPQVKTHPAPAVVEGHERGNEIFVERFMNSIRSDCEDAVANDFLGVGVEVARYTLACVSGKNSNLNPSFRDLGRSSAVARREARLATAACILSR